MHWFSNALEDSSVQMQGVRIRASLWAPECNAGLFSATQTEAVQALARAGLRNPVRINVAVAGAPSSAAKGADAGGGQKTPSELSIRYLVCDVEQKLPYLVRFLQVRPASLPHPFHASHHCHVTCDPTSGLKLLATGPDPEGSTPSSVLRFRSPQDVLATRWKPACTAC